jgi:AraC-like DNA-binding protein
VRTTSLRRVYPGEIDHEIDVGRLAAIPDFYWDKASTAACAAIYERYVAPGTSGRIPDAAFCDLPRWVFLDYLVQHCGIVLAGSPDDGLERLEPITLADNLIGWDMPRYVPFLSGIEAIYNAILDRPRLRQLGCGGRVTIALPFGVPVAAGKRFYFGLDYRALAHAPWRNGTVYLYRASDFPADLAQTVRPLAQLKVSPHDWPLLDQVYGIHIPVQRERLQETICGYPWCDDDAIHPHHSKRTLAQAIRAHLDASGTEPISLTQLGAMTGLSPFAVLRHFRTVTGQSPHEYHLRRRLIRAKNLLKQGSPIAAAATETGFSDQAHLTRHFRDAFGLTPGHYLRLQESSRQ